MKKILLVVLVFSFALLVPAAMAQQSGKEPVKATAPQKTVPPKTLYKCPMHPEEISDQPGKCPKCGMVMTESGPVAYYCPRHSHEVSDKPMPCPKCKKEMMPTTTPERFQGSKDN